MKRLPLLLALLLAWSMPTLAADDDIQAFVQADRLEYADSESAIEWDLQGAIGDDYRKLWIKSEGELESGSVEHSEIQALYSRAWTAYFDWQLGLRFDIDPSPTRTHLVFGLQGLAPQWFEVDTALFLSEDGDLSLSMEAEYDLLLTQRLVLQPRLEFELSASDVPELGIGSGLVGTELGLRLRYELHRKFAPYIGVEWSRLYGDTADAVRSLGGEHDDVTLLLGFRAWY